MGHICFNSSMVRLKVEFNEKQKDLELFQFQYGAIKGMLKVRENEIKLSFNSSMVRLKE